MRGKATYQRQYWAGMIVLLAVMIFLLSAFSMLAKTDQVETYLMDTASRRCGWSYVMLVDGKGVSAEPEFLDEYRMKLSHEIQALKIEKIFSEAEGFEWIGIDPCSSGIEIFLDQDLFYSDFQGGERNEDGFLLLKEEDEAGIPDGFRKIQLSLPENCMGKNLSVLVYFAEGNEYRAPVYPYLGNSRTRYAAYVTGSVLPIAVQTLCGILTILLAVIFILDTADGKGDYKILLLIVFYFLLFLDKTYNSFLGEVSVLTKYLDVPFLLRLYITPLFLYLALCLTGWRKYVLSACAAVWCLYEGSWMYLSWKQDNLILSNRNGMGEFLLFVVMLSALCAEAVHSVKYAKRGQSDYMEGESRNWPVKRYGFYAALTVSVLFIRILFGSAEWNGNIGIYLYQVMFSAVRSKYFYPVINITADVCATMSVIILIFEFIHRTIEMKQLVAALEERSRLTMEGYNRMLDAEEATNSVRHEMRHHMIALAGMLKEKETERASEYIASVTEKFDELPTFRYSKNVLVDVIVGNYLDRAKQEGIEVSYSLQVPEKLEIEDEDICVFLTNMLENAVQACEQMPQEQERYIRVQMHTDQNFLFISCANSIPSGTVSEAFSGVSSKRQEHKVHGYGMAAMGRIAEKYGSILKIDKTSSEFCVKSNLCLRFSDNK